MPEPRAASRERTGASGASPWHDALRRLRRNRLAMVGLGVLACLILGSLLAPWIAPYAYDRTDLRYGAKPPSRTHLLGTDVLGRDLLTRILYGARISFAVGLLATLVSLTIGVSYGSAAGSAGGRLDHLMMRVVDILYGLPFMFFVIILMVILGRNILNLFIALGAVQWLTMARIVRGQVMSLKVREFVLSAQAMGASASRILTRHLLPNALGPIVVYATLTVPAVMLEEAFLSFLGLGVQPPMASWGSLASEGAAAMETYPWLIVFPGLALTLTLLSLNFVGDGLRDALDPQMAARR
ncbi:MAG TPA: ABC transporter permease [Candidatus Methylomirabilis sp.]|nr:ABC transporter permease [Candidatus Methylomirabilis sp.]HSC70570.1 ABC transporter permease [Candidatus Methylomirabilis sp.]